MRMRQWHGLRKLCLTAFAVTLCVTPAFSADNAKSTNKKGRSKTAVARQKLIVIQIPGANPRKPHSKATTRRVIVREIHEGSAKMKVLYWVGLNCTPASEALQAHLRLPKKRGLLVVDVVGKSSSAQAKIARHDVLLKFADKDLSTLDDLIVAVQSVKGKEATVWLIRAGKKRMVKITPKKRPQPQSFLSSDRLLHDLHHERARELLKKYLAEASQRKSPDRFQMRFFGPGIVLAPSGNRQPFRGRLEIKLTRQNGAAAKIVVKIDGKTFIADEKHLGKLPASVRDAVKNVLGRGRGGKDLIEYKIRDFPAPPQHRFRTHWGWPVRPKDQAGPRKPQNIEKKLDELLKQMKQLQQSVQQLKRSGGK